MDAKTIAEVSGLEDGFPVTKFVGVIGFIKKQEERTFKGKTGEDVTQKEQGIAVKDNTGSVWVEIVDHQEIPIEAKGKTITIEGWKNDKNEWKGVKKTSYIDKDKNTKVKIHVTKTGKFTIGVEEKKEEPKKEEPKKESVKSEQPETTKVLPLSPNVIAQNLIKDTSIAISYAIKLMEMQSIKLIEIPDATEAIVKLMYGKKEESQKIFTDLSIKFGEEVGE